MKLLLVLLGILKILGAFLLAVLALVLILVLVVLLTPLRYEIKGEKLEKISGSFAIRWLFGAIHIEGVYNMEKGMQIGGRIFGFPLDGKKKEKKLRGKKKGKEKKAPEPSISMRSRPPAEPPKTQEEPRAATEKPYVTEGAKQRTEEKTPSTQPLAENLEEQTEKPRVRRIRMADIPEEPSRYQELPPEFFTGEAEESPQEQEKKEGLDLQYFLHMPDKKGLLKICFAFLKRVCKGVFPKNIFVQATIGMGDPALTGYVLAAAGAAKAKFGENLQVKGEFRHLALEDVIIRIKGKIIIGYLAYALLRFALAKPVWKIIKIYWKGSR